MEEKREVLTEPTVETQPLNEHPKEKLSNFKIFGIVSGVSLVVAAILLSAFFLYGQKEQTQPNDQIAKVFRRFKDEDLEFTEEEHRDLSRQFATEGMILAQNTGLPIQKTDKVVLFGKGTKATVYGGWGSGEVYQKGTSSNIVPIQVLAGMETKGKEGKFTYQANSKLETGDGLTEADVASLSQKGSSKRSVAVMTISRRSGEGSDRHQDDGEAGTLLTFSENQTYNLLTKYFDLVVVVLNVGSVMEIPNMVGQAKTSIVISFLPGMEAGNAIADVLVGDKNPYGRLSDTWAQKIDDYPTTKTFKESRDYVKYKETLFVGYRYFEIDDEKASKVVFPFGFGLSYTTFDITSNCNFANDVFTCTATVKNTGNYKGKEVIQVYAKKPQNENFIKANRELVAFAKTKELNPGESETLTLKVELNYLSSYDETGVTGNLAAYVLEAGEYQIFVATNVAETRKPEALKYTYKLDRLRVTEKLTTKLPPQDPDVANANKMPDFSKFMGPSRSRCYKEEKYTPEPIEEMFEESPNNMDLPTDQYNEINFKSVLQGKYTIDQLAKVISNEELAYLSFGHGGKIKSGTGSIGGNYNADVTGKYIIPHGDTNDGPAGLRQSEVNMQSAAWPCSTLLACTFDVDVMNKVGEETGKEARKIGTAYWLAPGMNIHRSPLCGRNFEYYSEDPFLAGKMAAAITRGLQSKRVSITLKHFCVNNKEDNRQNSDSRMAERVAREIYLRGFEIAVKEAQPWAIMTSYNKINSIKTSANYDLLTGILRNEWKFDGVIMTDWGTNSKIANELKAGGNIKMPGNSGGVNEVIDALQKGLISRENLENVAKYMLTTYSRTFVKDPILDKPDPIEITNGAHIKMITNIFNKYPSISYEACQDTDGGYNPTNTDAGTWVTLYVRNLKARTVNARIRYSGNVDGFGVKLKKFSQDIGMISNLRATGGWQNWQTSNNFMVELPQGVYEMTIVFNGGGNINWLEIDA